MFFTTTRLPIEEKTGLYCVWIRQNERPGAPLVAVWIDPAMSAYEERAIAGPGIAWEELHACEEG